MKIKRLSPAATRQLSALTLLALALLSACLTGCTNVSANRVSSENDRLRAENLELKRNVETLQQRVKARVAELDAQRAASGSPGSSDPALTGADVPQAASLHFGRYSAAVDGDQDGQRELLRLYLMPRDQFGRFLPTAGALQAQAVWVQPGTQPVVLGETSLTPAQWDQAYRTGITGTHYTVELPLPAPLPAQADSATVKVALTDAATGRTLTAEMTATLR